MDGLTLNTPWIVLVFSLALFVTFSSLFPFLYWYSIHRGTFGTLAIHGSASNRRTRKRLRQEVVSYELTNIKLYYSDHDVSDGNDE